MATPPNALLSLAYPERSEGKPHRRRCVRRDAHATSGT